MPQGGAGQRGSRQPVRTRSRAIQGHPARIEQAYGKSKLAILVSCPPARRKEPEILTPASPDSLPPIRELIADEPFWRYRTGTAAESVAHLRVWLTAGPAPGHLAVVTEVGSADQATQSAGHIWAELSRRYRPSLVLLEHHLAPQAAEGAETLDLVRIGADGNPHWLRIWPTPAEHPSHTGLELWMATYGNQIAGQPASWFDRCEDDRDLSGSSKLAGIGLLSGYRSCPTAARSPLLPDPPDSEQVMP
jgi:hypothetical protein